MDNIEEKIHAVLHDLEVKLQSLFGSHPKIAEHVATAKAEASAAIMGQTAVDPAEPVTPVNESSQEGKPEPEPAQPVEGHAEPGDATAA